jgi:hypothetical protein
MTMNCVSSAAAERLLAVTGDAVQLCPRYGRQAAAEDADR